MAEQQTKRGRGGAADRNIKTRPGNPSAALIDTNQAADRLGVTPRFVRRLVDERRIPFHKIGRYVRFDPADIDRFAMDGRVETYCHPWHTTG